MRLSRFQIRLPAPASGAGARPRRRAGTGDEFFQLRPYVPGDDLRRVDWRATAKSGRVWVRETAQRAPARFHLWLDGSKSMQLYGKAAYAERLTRVLIEASRGDRLRLLGPKGPQRPRFPPPAAEVPLLAARPRARGLILITDGLMPGDWEGYLGRLPPFHLLLVLAPEELSPPPRTTRLRDVETGEEVEVDAAAVRAYKEALRAHLARLRRAAKRGQVTLLRVGEPILPRLLKARVLEPR